MSTPFRRTTRTARALRHTTLVLSVLAPLACEPMDPSTSPDDPPEEVVVSAVRVLPESSAVLVGRTLTLTAEARDASGNRIPGETVTFSSSDTAVAEIDASGVLTAKRSGRVDVEARVRGVRGTGRVVAQVEPVASVLVSPSRTSVQVASEVTLSASTRSASDAVLSGRAVVWSSTATSIATVDASGRVRGIAPGSAVIRATSEGIVGTAQVDVSAAPPPPVPGTVADLSVASVSDSGLTLRFTEVGNGSGAAATYDIRYARSPITFSTASTPARGTCSASFAGTGVGNVRTCTILGLSSGTAYSAQVVAYRGTLGAGAVLGATSNIASATTTVPAVATVTLAPTTASVLTGATQAFGATLRDASGAVLTGRSVTWSSSNTAVATVNGSGVATGVTAGTATITATSEGRSGSASLTVSVPAPAPVATVTLAPTTASITTGSTRSFVATLRDSAGTVLTGRSVTWTSSNPAIATVSSGGVATGVAAGTATITATSEGRSGSATLTVTVPAPAPVATVTLTPTTASVFTTASQTFVATLRDAGGNTLTGRSISWTSSNAAVASVSASGVALGLTVGTSTITATSEGRTATATLTVVTPPPPPPPGTFTFSSDWSAATGTSATALRDGGKWDNLYCQQAGTTLTVVPGSTVGWTKTANVLRLQELGPSACGMLEKLDAVPQSTTHWGRFYFRNDEVGARHNHVATLFPVGTIQLALWSRYGTAAGVNVFLRTYWTPTGAAQPYPTNVWSMGTAGRQQLDFLPNGVWYRYEWMMEYVTPTTYRIWPRIYDMSDNLLYDATRFYQSDYPQSGAHSLASYYAAGNTFGLTDASMARRFGIGNEGPGGSTLSGMYWYHADVALSTTGWIGR